MNLLLSNISHFPNIVRTDKKSNKTINQFCTCPEISARSCSASSHARENLSKVDWKEIEIIEKREKVVKVFNHGLRPNTLFIEYVFRAFIFFFLEWQIPISTEKGRSTNNNIKCIIIIFPFWVKNLNRLWGASNDSHRSYLTARIHLYSYCFNYYSPQVCLALRIANVPKLAQINCKHENFCQSLRVDYEKSICKNHH